MFERNWQEPRKFLFADFEHQKIREKTEYGNEALVRTQKFHVVETKMVVKISKEKRLFKDKSLKDLTIETGGSSFRDRRVQESKPIKLNA